MFLRIFLICHLNQFGIISSLQREAHTFNNKPCIIYYHHSQQIPPLIKSLSPQICVCWRFLINSALWLLAQCFQALLLLEFLSSDSFMTGHCSFVQTSLFCPFLPLMAVWLNSPLWQVPLMGCYRHLCADCHEELVVSALEYANKTLTYRSLSNLFERA